MTVARSHLAEWHRADILVEPGHELDRAKWHCGTLVVSEEELKTSRIQRRNLHKFDPQGWPGVSYIYGTKAAQRLSLVKQRLGATIQRRISRSDDLRA